MLSPGRQFSLEKMRISIIVLESITVKALCRKDVLFAVAYGQRQWSGNDPLGAGVAVWDFIVEIACKVMYINLDFCTLLNILERIGLASRCPALGSAGRCTEARKCPSSFKKQDNKNDTYYIIDYCYTLKSTDNAMNLVTPI